MTKKPEELTILKQIFGTLSEQDKQFFVDYLLNSKTVIKEVSQPREVKTCPQCELIHFVKNGCGDGKQRYLCRDCKKSFIRDTGTIFKSTKEYLSVWKTVHPLQIEKYPLRKCARECNFSLYMAFTWRHKILDALQNMMDNVTLDGVVETNETFTNASGTKILSCPVMLSNEVGRLLNGAYQKRKFVFLVVSIQMSYLLQRFQISGN